MAEAADQQPMPVADEDPNLTRQIRKIMTEAQVDADLRLTGQVPEPMKPDGIFDRSQSNTWLREAVTNTPPGVSGDLVLSIVQMEYLSIMDRAYRARHTATRPRMLCHAMGRRLGHAAATGPLVQNVLEFVRDVKKMEGRR